MHDRLGAETSASAAMRYVGSVQRLAGRLAEMIAQARGFGCLFGAHEAACSSARRSGFVPVGAADGSFALSEGEVN
jgi:hypothetical protein